MDLSNLSTEDLLALKGGDLSKVSTEGLHALKQQSIHAAAAADTANFEATLDPTAGMSGMDKFNAGAGKAFSDLGLGIRQRLGMASRADVQDSRRLDAPLMRSGAGMAGDVMGNLTMLAPTAALTGGTVPAAAALSGAFGFLQPSASVKEDVLNTGLAAAGGAGGQYIANLAGGAAGAQATRNATSTAQNAQKTQAAQNASKAGYVIPPEDVGNAGIGTRVLQGIGGKIKTAQEASQRNQGLTNVLAKTELGLSEADALTPKVLEDIRRQAGQAYQQVRGAGMVSADPAYNQAVSDIAAKYKTASPGFPGLGPKNMHGQPIDEVGDLVAAMKQPQFDSSAAVDAISILLDKADKAFASGDKTIAKASKDAAAALEDMLERHLQAGDNPDALKAFQDARQLIAKTYSVQKGLNGTTGDVATGALVKQLEKGRPLSGNLLTIAQAGQAFPKATQALKEAPKSLSPLDMALAVIQRDPMALATLGARPAARSVLLSKPMQQSALQSAATPQEANALLRMLSQEQLTLPASFAGSNALASYLTQKQ